MLLLYPGLVAQDLSRVHLQLLPGLLMSILLHDIQGDYKNMISSHCFLLLVQRLLFRAVTIPHFGQDCQLHLKICHVHSSTASIRKASIICPLSWISCAGVRVCDLRYIPEGVNSGLQESNMQLVEEVKEMKLQMEHEREKQKEEE